MTQKNFSAIGNLSRSSPRMCKRSSASTYMGSSQLAPLVSLQRGASSDLSLPRGARLRKHLKNKQQPTARSLHIPENGGSKATNSSRKSTWPGTQHGSARNRLVSGGW